jgi:hypothetical protein
MTDMIPLMMLGMVVNLVTVFVLFAPPAHTVFNNHPECSIAEFSPDLTKKQKQFCREWNKK